ncbi:hypothetical protein E3N88_10101 [Mikania micrantha]|uniref:Uncharacterized protein n=1 Tax=Mikania micrantha TaxID=192012 RepID=A0A5N6P9Q3_9ASTR|nr:hypothetical protein E3N88_10101 [Mikania micrantha]
MAVLGFSPTKGPVSIVSNPFLDKLLLEVYLQVHNCVANGGKVLIPTFALGRAQILSREHKKHDYMEVVKNRYKHLLKAQALAEANKQGKLAQTYHGESIEKKKSNGELIVPQEAYQRSLYITTKLFKKSNECLDKNQVDNSSSLIV